MYASRKTEGRHLNGPLVRKEANEDVEGGFGFSKGRSLTPEIVEHFVEDGEEYKELNEAKENEEPVHSKSHCSAIIPWEDIECRKLVKSYIANKAAYLGGFKAASKNGWSVQDELANKWAIEITQLGFAIRSRDQIKEKIRSLRKSANQHLLSEQNEMKKTGGGSRKSANSSDCIKWFAADLLTEAASKGIAGAIESEAASSHAHANYGSTESTLDQTVQFVPQISKIKMANNRTRLYNHTIAKKDDEVFSRQQLIKEQMELQKLKQILIKNEIIKVKLEIIKIKHDLDMLGIEYNSI